MHKILLFVPCYNCAPQIVRVLDQLDGDIVTWLSEILIIDNGSTDGTTSVTINYLKNKPLPIPTKVVRNEENYNLGGSHKAAFQYAAKHNFTHVLVMHGDDQARIIDILPILKNSSFLHYDACLGSRFMKGSVLDGYSWFRIFGNRVFNMIFSLIACRCVDDLGSGLNIFSETIFRDKAVNLYADDLRFNIFLLLGIFYRKRHVTFFPIKWVEEDQISNVKVITQTLNTLKIALLYIFQRRKFILSDHRIVPRSSYSFHTLLNTKKEGK